MSNPSRASPLAVSTKIKEGTISAHLIRFSTNAPSRLHYSVKADEDLLFQPEGSHFRLYNAATDPAPIHWKSDVTASQEKFIEPSEVQSPSELAFKTKALPALSFPLGAGSLDILALDAQRCFVVIELKVSRGYDRVIGQLLR